MKQVALNGTEENARKTLKIKAETMMLEPQSADPGLNGAFDKSSYFQSLGKPLICVSVSSSAKRGSLHTSLLVICKIFVKLRSLQKAL